jgi:hypothetical protein
VIFAENGIDHQSAEQKQQHEIERRHHAGSSAANQANRKQQSAASWISGAVLPVTARMLFP